MSKNKKGDGIINFPILGDNDMFVPVVLKASELGISEKINKVSVLSEINGEMYVIPYQIDEVREEDRMYFEGDGKFSGYDELVFFVNYCGKKLTKDEIKRKTGEKIKIFEVEVEGKFCYILVGDNVGKIPRKKEKLIEYENSPNDFLVKTPGRIAVFDNTRPLVKEIKIEVDGKMIKVFGGMHADMELKLFDLIKIKKTEEDVESKVVFLKGGDVRIIRVVKPYLDIFAGIKIPTSESTTIIYPGYTIVYNTVKIPFTLGAISKSAFAVVYLNFIGVKKVMSRENKIYLDKFQEKENNINIRKEDGHSWAYIEGNGWSAFYYIKEITKIPIKRYFYFRANGKDSVNVGIKLDLITLPKGEHKFALYGFFFPPGGVRDVKKVINPPKVKLREL